MEGHAGKSAPDVARRKSNSEHLCPWEGATQLQYAFAARNEHQSCTMATLWVVHIGDQRLPLALRRPKQRPQSDLEKSPRTAPRENQPITKLPHAAQQDDRI
jgi:hypothetical protein